MYGNDRGGHGFGPQRFAPVKVGDELDVKIEAVGEKGDGIAKKDGFVLFVPNVNEGDEVKIKVNKVLRKVGFAEVIGSSTGSTGDSSSDDVAASAEEEPEISEEEMKNDSEDFGEDDDDDSEEDKEPAEEDEDEADESEEDEADESEEEPAEEDEDEADESEEKKD
ncbi:TRAM domain-containing protein [Candidatus Woesearchaeota archaeon]|nr:TRAM domain-containing protein [Candidatus Woesearchaeota archaeon]